jgi:membrane protein DedA with SNARE-associated domain
MTLQQLIETYGYLAVFVGALLEGETVLMLAGFAAQRGYLELPWVITVALIGGFLGDQFYFFLGRRYGKRITARYPVVHERAAKVHEWLHRYHAPLIVGIRFMYGFRIIGPIVLGMGHVPALKFMALNFIGACLWAVLIAGAGYLFSEALDTLPANGRRYEYWGFAAIVLIGLGVWALHRYRARYRNPLPGLKQD